MTRHQKTQLASEIFARVAKEKVPLGGSQLPAKISDSQAKDFWNFLLQPSSRGYFCAYSEFAEYNTSRSYLRSFRESLSLTDILCILIVRYPNPEEKSFQASYVSVYERLSAAEIQPSNLLEIDMLDPGDSICSARIEHLLFSNTSFDFGSTAQQASYLSECYTWGFLVSELRKRLRNLCIAFYGRDFGGNVSEELNFAEICSRLSPEQKKLILKRLHNNLATEG
jgi:hypothetical protein